MASRGAFSGKTAGFQPFSAPARGVLISIGSSITRVVIQLGQFILVARALGPSEFGVFVALVGLCAAISNLAGWGAGILYTRDVAARPGTDDAARLSAAMRLFALASLSISSLVFLGYLAVFSQDLPALAVALIIGADLVCGTFILFANRVLLAHDRFVPMSRVELAFAALRLLAAVAFVLSGGNEAQDWALFYFIVSVVAAAHAFVVIGGRRALTMKPAWPDRAFRDGFVLSSGATAQMARRNIDRPIALAVLGPEGAGLFGAAARFVEAALIPIFSFSKVIQRRFFSAGANGAAYSFMTRMLPVVLALGVAAAVGLAGLSFFLEALLGPEYAGASWMLTLMILVPLANALSALAGDGLVTAGRQNLRLIVDLAAFAVKLAACTLGAQIAGLPGLVLAVVLVDLALAAAYWIIASVLVRERCR